MKVLNHKRLPLGIEFEDKAADLLLKLTDDWEWDQSAKPQSPTSPTPATPDKINNMTDKEFSNGVDELIAALKEDKEPGSYYHGWQSNIAMAFFDTISEWAERGEFILKPRSSFAVSDMCNAGAKRFLEILCSQVASQPIDDESPIDRGEQNLVSNGPTNPPQPTPEKDAIAFPTPTSIKTAEEILDEHCDSLPMWTVARKAATLKAMREYKNQPTGDKWSDEDMRDAYREGWDGHLKAIREGITFFTSEEWLSNKKSKQ